MLVTVIMPSYNASNTIGRAIDSVISQEFENWELIIVDDCSSDDTRSVVEPYLSEKIKLVELSENSGSPAKPRNVALSLAKGDYIAFLDSDDVWYVNKLSRQISYMLASGSKFSCTGYDIADENRNYKFIPPKLINYNDLIKNNTIGCLTAIV
ncbi:glycosyltransferase family 2 protein, partial [Vibrio splendidus]|uniref:glycosyltransferase family 2 protein n=1 Tax=Vibrio splendidus TaxID=29497 RepID=UPI003D143539